MGIRRIFDRTVRLLMPAALAIPVFLIAATSALAASGDLSWSYIADSPPHWNDYGRLVASAPEGTVYVAAEWASSVPGNDGDICLVRLRAQGTSGSVVWRRFWDDPVHHLYDSPRALTTDPGGNAIVGGTSSSTVDDSDWVVIKWKPSGRRAWISRFASRYGMQDYISDVACDGKGDVYLTGFRYLLGNQDADWVMVKLRASDGKRLWTRVWSGQLTAASDDRPEALAVDDAGYSYAAGSSSDAAGVDDAILMKRTPAGKLLWTRRVDGAAHGSDWAKCVALAGGAVYVSGSIEAADRSHDLLQLKYGTNGRRLWQSTWSPVAWVELQPRDLAVDRFGNAVVAGIASGSAGDQAVVASWSPSGAHRWTNVSISLPGSTSRSEAVVLGRQGTVWIAGTARVGSDEDSGLLMKYSAAGSHIWTKLFDGEGTHRDGFADLCLWGPDSLAAAGYTVSEVGQADLHVAKYVR